MKLTIVGLVLLVAACGDGGDGEASGTLDLFHRSNASSSGPCGLQWSIKPVAGGPTQFANTGPCQNVGLDLIPGQYNVAACGSSGGCTFSRCFQQTVTINEGQRTPVQVRCSGCTQCP